MPGTSTRLPHVKPAPRRQRRTTLAPLLSLWRQPALTRRTDQMHLLRVNAFPGTARPDVVDFNQLLPFESPPTEGTPLCGTPTRPSEFRARSTIRDFSYPPPRSCSECSTIALRRKRDLFASSPELESPGCGFSSSSTKLACIQRRASNSVSGWPCRILNTAWPGRAGRFLRVASWWRQLFSPLPPLHIHRTSC